MDGRTLPPLFLLLAYAAYAADARELQAEPLPGEKCGFDGNADMYGIGIRVGVYVQAFAATVAHAYGQESARGIDFTNDFFQFSMLLGLVYLTVINSSLEVAEAAIIHVFTICCGSFNATGPGAKLSFSRPNSIRAFGRNILPLWKLSMTLASDGYWMWYWFYGLDTLQLSPCTGYGFLFARVSLVGWFRTVGKVATVAIITVDLYLLYHVLRYGRAFRLPKLWVGFVTPKKRGEAWWWGRNGIGVIVTCGLVALYATAVELMIVWNHVRDVNQLLGSVGQLIPLLLAGGSMVALVLEWDSGNRPECERCRIGTDLEAREETLKEAGAMGAEVNKVKEEV